MASGRYFDAPIVSLSLGIFHSSDLYRTRLLLSPVIVPENDDIDLEHQLQ